MSEQIKLTLEQAFNQMVVGDEFKFCGAGDMRVVCVSSRESEKHFKWAGFKTKEFTLVDYLETSGCIGYLKINKPEKSAFQEWNDNRESWPLSGLEARKQGWNAAIGAIVLIAEIDERGKLVTSAKEIRKLKES